MQEGLPAAQDSTCLQLAAVCPERGQGRLWPHALAMLLRVGALCAPGQVRSAHLGAASRGNGEAGQARLQCMAAASPVGSFGTTVSI